MSIAYSLGADFNSCPVQERAKRTKGLINLVATATNEVMEEILDEFNASKHPGEESIKRKHGKQSPFVQGGLPSLGKRR
ncbi:MAG: hypothetical protein ABSG32_34035 [Terriglobia bacterium]